jgi:hypothetical protein
MIQLGSFDTIVTEAQRAAYLQQATAISGGRGDLAAEGSDKLAFAPHAPEPQQPMTVADSRRRAVPTTCSLTSCSAWAAIFLATLYVTRC